MASDLNECWIDVTMKPWQKVNRLWRHHTWRREIAAMTNQCWCHHNTADKMAAMMQPNETSLKKTSDVTCQNADVTNQICDVTGRNVDSSKHHILPPLLILTNSGSSSDTNPLTTTIGRPFFGHKSPAARELFKPSADSASLLVDIEIKRFLFSVGVFWKWRHNEGMFWKFWSHLASPGPQPIDPFYWFNVLLKTRSKSASIEPLIDLLAFL